MPSSQQMCSIKIVCSYMDIVFGNTYLCDKMFSKMNYLKSNNGSTLTSCVTSDMGRLNILGYFVQYLLCPWIILMLADFLTNG